MKSVLNIHWKDWCWSWNSNTLATWCKELTQWKRPWCWERLKSGGEGNDRGWDGWMASLTQWTCVWVNSGNWWWTGRPCMLQSMGSQRVGQDWETELNWIPEICDQAVFFSGDAISLWGIPVFQHLASLALSNTYVIDCDDQKCSPQNFQGPSREPSHSHWEALGTSHKIMICFSSATWVLVGNRQQSGLMCAGFDRQEQPSRLLCPLDFSGKNTGTGCHFLLQRIFWTQGSNPSLLYCRQSLYHCTTREACIGHHSLFFLVWCELEGQCFFFILMSSNWPNIIFEKTFLHCSVMASLS